MVILKDDLRMRMTVEVGNEVFENIRGQVPIFLLSFSFKIVLSLLF